MGNKTIEVVICRTCLRDNPGEGNFSDFESNTKFYQEHFKEGWLGKTAKLNFQNCFAYCEKFYCVQVTQGGRGFLFSRISDGERQQELIQWVRQCKTEKQLSFPEKLKEHIIAPVEK